MYMLYLLVLTDITLASSPVVLESMIQISDERSTNRNWYWEDCHAG